MNPQPKPRQSRIIGNPLQAQIESRINNNHNYPDIARFCQQSGENITTSMVAYYARHIMGYRRPKITPINDIERAKIFKRINKYGISDSAMTREFKAAYNALNERMGW